MEETIKEKQNKCACKPEQADFEDKLIAFQEDL